MLDPERLSFEFRYDEELPPKVRPPRLDEFIAVQVGPGIPNEHRTGGGELARELAGRHLTVVGRHRCREHRRAVALEIVGDAGARRYLGPCHERIRALKIDGGKKDVVGDLDLKTLRRPGREQSRVNVDFPNWMVESLDREATRLGVTRQSIIKVWIAERLEKAS